MNRNYALLTAQSKDVAVRLLVDCFCDDSYFQHLCNSESCEEVLSDMFCFGISFCLDNGFVYGCFEEERLVAVSLWFNYNQSKNDCADEFKRIFVQPGSHDYDTHTLLYSVDKHIGDNPEYLYLLLIAVDKAYRRKGIASDMISRVKTCYCNYNIFSDVSNLYLSEYLISKQGFEEVDICNKCHLLQYRTTMHEALSKCLTLPKIPVVIPPGISKNIFPEVTAVQISIPFIRPKVGTPLFVKGLDYETSAVELVFLSRIELYKWQQIVNMLICEELLVDIDGTKAVVYVRCDVDSEICLNYDSKLLRDISEHYEEWECMVDVYTLVPMLYDKDKQFAVMDKLGLNVRYLIDSLDFRTKYESGIYIEDGLNGSFYERISRKVLEICTIQLYREDTISCNIDDNMEIGQPVAAALLLSYDKNTLCAVLHIILLSSGLFPTQYLDSISRNQLYLIKDGSRVNLYEYLGLKYGLHKRGTPKNYISIHSSRNDVSDNLLASILYCETYYQQGESLGRVIDPDIMRQIEREYGASQYDYASAYFYTNSVVHIDDELGAVKNRIIGQSVTLFYIEMVLYEEVAIEIMNYDVVKFLTDVDQYSHRRLIKHINELLNRHLKTIAFWNISMNYPSSTRSVDLIKQAFGIESKRQDVERNKKQLITVAQLRENYLSYLESRIISTLGALLTIISIAEFVIDPSKSSTLIYVGIAFVIIWVYIQKRLSSIDHRK